MKEYTHNFTKGLTKLIATLNKYGVQFEGNMTCDTMHNGEVVCDNAIEVNGYYFIAHNGGVVVKKVNDRYYSHFCRTQKNALCFLFGNNDIVPNVKMILCDETGDILGYEVTPTVEIEETQETQEKNKDVEKMEKYTSLQDIKNVMSRLNELQEKSSNELTIDINEVLENLSSYECDQYIYDWGYCDCDYDENCEDCGGDGEYEEKMLVSEWVERMEFDGMLNEVKHDNTYNYNSPISNHVDFRILQKNHDSEVIVELKVHMFGDVRANYTENIYLEFANEYEFFEAFQTSKAVTFEHNEKIYNVDFDVFSDSKEVYDENYNHLLTSYEYDLNNIKKQIEDNE